MGGEERRGEERRGEERRGEEKRREERRGEVWPLMILDADRLLIYIYIYDC